jgi:putative addiction module component (TIGR02574 family)
VKTIEVMSTNILEEVSKLTRHEKIELARFLFEEIASYEAEDEFELSDEQKADLEEAWAEIENGTAELYSGEEISKELNERYGVKVSIP